MLSASQAQWLSTSPEPSETLSRTPARILSARTLEDVRVTLPAVLRDLFTGDVRFELFIDAGRGALAPVLDAGEVRSGGGWSVLESLASHLAITRQALASSHAFPAPRHRQGGSVMSSPLFDASEQLLGALVIERAHGEPDFTRMELVALEGTCALLSMAIQRLHVTRPELSQGRIHLDRRSAGRVQRNLMSRGLPPDVGVTALSEYLPAFDVGGDFFSLEYLGEGRIGAAIGDVSGNGVSAALVMSRVALDIDRALRAGDSPAHVLRKANEGLSNLESDRFVTVSCIRLDTHARKVTVANAGHLPLVVRRANGHAFTCAGASGMPLGTIPCEYDEEELILEPKDILLLMTDGLLEALDHPSGRMGMNHLLGLVRTAPHDPKLIHARIREVVDRARNDHVLDDVAWVELQLLA